MSLAIALLLLAGALLLLARGVRRHLCPPRVATAVPAPTERQHSAFDYVHHPAFHRTLMAGARDMAKDYAPGQEYPLECTTPAGTRFRFTLKRQGNGSWRIYIDHQPRYGSRSNGGHETHRYVDAAGRHFICWDGEIDRLELAVFVAGLWAHMTERYIATGEPF
ncbi:MAG: hypothetical protein EPO55_00670 [Reyranella sp.]|uniref:hypothetical protein n=1 Tax=Reyranella sp. TaxID=1929291 RepID=UPI0012012611|nr:hypothetical protein [Reyranella sp.]TAJ42774.1 MAG: hypothetical protein EPO55_00670 [Reyranella sp.]